MGTGHNSPVGGNVRRDIFDSGAEDPGTLQMSAGHASRVRRQRAIQRLLALAMVVALFGVTLIAAWYAMSPRQAEPPDHDAVQAPAGDERAGQPLAAGLDLLAIDKAKQRSEAIPATVPPEIVVDANGGGDSGDLAAAIAAAPAGATVRVRPGTYTSPLKLDKDVHVIGTPENPAEVIVSVSNPSCLVAGAADASVTGITLRNSGPQAEPCVVVNSGRLRLADVAITSDSGVGLSVGPQAEVLGKALRIINTGQHGVDVRDGGRLILEASAIEGSGGAGAQIVKASDVEFRDSRVAGGKGVGIIVADDSSLRLIGSTLADNARSGIEALRTRGIVIADSTVTGNREAGLFLNRNSDATIIGSRVANNGLSGAIVMGSSARFERNRFEANAEHGIYLTRGGRAALANNDIESNRGHGVAVEGDSRAELRENRIEGNKTPDVIGPATAVN